MTAQNEEEKTDQNAMWLFSFCRAVHFLTDDSVFEAKHLHGKNFVHVNLLKI